MAADYSVYVGATGWAPAGACAFYPDDLPADWRLAYYQNRYRGVFLTRADWSAHSRDVWREWAAQTHPGFRFLCESPSSELLSAMDGRGLDIASVADDVHRINSDTDSRKLVAVIRDTVARGQRVWLISASGPDASCERAQALADMTGY
jgi:hypothetical protein